MWTDWTVPEIDFDIYLTGYDVQSFDMKNIFCDRPGEAPGGDLPSTLWSAAGFGPYSLPGSLPPGCASITDYGPGAIVPPFQEHLRAAFSGAPDNVGLCHGSMGNGTYHGYVTIEANRGCSLDFPAQPSYWTSGVVYNDEAGNVLMGDYQYHDLGTGLSEGFTMVHLEAFGEIAAGPGPSFYSRYTGDGSDGREPLPTTYAARYNATGAVDKTYFQIWRTGGVATSPVACDTNPWAACNLNDACDGLDARFALAFNNDEDVVINTGGPSGGPPRDEICIDLEAQRLDVLEELDAGFLNGWYYLNLQSPGQCSDGQAYLTVTQELKAASLCSGGWDAVALDGSCTQFATTAPTTLPTQPTAQNPALQ